jgi:glucose/arabinose dehydrogenase
MRQTVLAAFVALSVAVSLPGAARATLPSDYEFDLVHPNTQFSLAATIRFSPEGRLWVAEIWPYTSAGARVRVWPDSAAASLPKTWATIPAWGPGGEKGLLNLAFHPQWPDSPWVYFFQTTPSPGPLNRIIRLRDSSGVGVNLTVIRVLSSGAATHHHGGRLLFDETGNLLVTHGEGDTSAYAGDPASTLRGKILRMSPMGEVLGDSPFGSNSLVSIYGVRNPFGLCMDPVTKRKYFTENGNACDDELNILVPGGNYGWKYEPTYQCGVVEAGTIAPMVRYTPTIAPTGAAFFRKAGDFSGQVMYGDFNNGELHRVFVDEDDPAQVDSVQTFWTSPDGQILDVCEGPDGLPYVLTLEGIYHARRLGTILDAAPPSALSRLSVTPNPFRREVSFSLPAGAPIDGVEILDLSGRRVREWHGSLPATIRWDGLDGAGSPVREGVYFVRARSGAEVLTRRFVRLGF